MSEVEWRALGVQQSQVMYIPVGTVTATVLFKHLDTVPVPYRISSWDRRSFCSNPYLPRFVTRKSRLELPMGNGKHDKVFLIELEMKESGNPDLQPVLNL